jgi:hypothetical protein
VMLKVPPRRAAAPMALRFASIMSIMKRLRSIMARPG